MPHFQSAVPVWPEGREREKNLFVGFRANFDATNADNALLRVTGGTVYRIFLNGAFLGYGPARGPHGWDRVDEWSLQGKCRPGKNCVAIEVAGYNVNSFYLLDQPAYLRAEIVAGDRVLAATRPAPGADAFEALILPRIQKVPRYSFQRPFGEAYTLRRDTLAWRTGGAGLPAAPLAAQAGRNLLPRIAFYPTFNLNRSGRPIKRGTVKANPAHPNFHDRAIDQIGPKLGGYPRNELTRVPIDEILKLECATMTEIDGDPAALSLTDNTFVILDWGLNDTGFVGAAVHCDQPCRIYLTFDEILSNGDVNPTRMGCSNVVSWDLTEPGDYALETFEPYTMRYAKVTVTGGACTFGSPYLRGYKNPATARARFTSSDPALNAIFAAARETFIQNAVDVFTDCPSRERAGWLCDSFFIGRVNALLCGNTDSERLFFQNYQLAERFPKIADGMVAMCYPSDHYDGVFIPNWSMWFIIELDEYLARSGDRAMVDALKPRVLGLIAFYKKYLNSDGLLEKLPSWVFVEWSRANSLVQDVSYPSNMTYAEVLSCVARLYNLPEYEAEAEKIRETIRKQSYNGTWFVDNAVRQKDGTLKLSGESTETCQYYAFFFKTATPQRYPELWAKLRDDFGPQRHQTRKHPSIHFANAFIGNYLRLEILSREGLSAQILNESKGYFMKMAQSTGTLWENDTPTASCNHGFASHVAVMLMRDILGIRAIDHAAKTITLAFADVPLERCEGTVPVGAEQLSVRWRKADGKLLYRVDGKPAGYTVKVISAIPVQPE